MENVSTRIAADTSSTLESERTLRRSQYVALALMYFAQGLPAGLAFNALGVLIRDGGHGVADVGWTGLAFLPWALKFLWAGAVDNACRRWGHARLIAATQWIAAVLCLALAAFPPSSALPLTLAAMVALNAVCATQDIVTNAYAVTRLRGRTAGPANAIQVAAFIAGMLAGGGGLLIVHAHLGWMWAMVLMAALMLAIHLALRIDRRWQLPVAPRREAPSAPVRLRDLRRRGDLIWALVVALSFKFASTASATLVQPWMMDRGLGLQEIGALQIITLISTALGGVLIGIPLVRCLSNRRAVWVAGILAVVVLGIPCLLNGMAVRNPAMIAIAFATQALFEGTFYVAIWALFLNWASPERPGTDYTVMQCSESLMNAVAAGAIGGLGQKLGYGGAFALVWVAGAAAFALVVWSLGRLHLYGECHERNDI